MNKLIMCVGLPRSGKSTFAKSSGYPIVSPDAIRLSMGSEFCKELEPMVWTVAKYMLKSLFLAGHEIVVLDATNVTESRRSEWYSKDYEIEYKIFDTDAKTCIYRAISTGKEYLIDIINRMNKEKDYEKLL